MMLLNRRESLKLFTRLMFARDDPMNTMFIQEVVNHAGGLPLVLKVWSRHFKQYEKEQWPSILETLKRIPHGDIQKKLQMSYDSLPDISKKLFLDIACWFFSGMRKDLVVKVLQDEDSGFYPDNEIQYLVDKSLVELIVEYKQLSLHHAIREMGQEVVRQEYADEPGQRTRLTGHRDVVRILRDGLGTKSVEGIMLGDHELRERVTIQVEALKKMSNLRFIRLLDPRLKWSSSSKNGTSSFSFKKLSNLRFFHLPSFKLCWSSSYSDEEVSSFSFKNLKYLEWAYFPFKCIDIDMANVMVIKLHDSKLKILWEGFKNLKKLRILDVSGSSSLTKTGNFIGLENLEELCFSRCERLEELHNSIGCLKNLVLLDLSHCGCLKRFPWEMIGKLKSLQELISYCPHIGLEGVNVIDPFLSSLKECRITKLELVECKMSKISHDLGNLKFLQYLDLERNKFPSLPDNLCQLLDLKYIDLDFCPCLTSIPNLPPKIEIVLAQNCESLVNLPSNMSELKFLKELVLDGCVKLEPGGFMKVTGLRNLQHLNMSKCNVSQISSEIGNLVSLKSLNLSENTFSSLPDRFSNLSKLEYLKISHCFQLELLPLLPSNLTKVEARGCGSSDVMSFDSMQTDYIFGSKVFQKSSFTRQLFISITRSEVPEWCCYQNAGEVLSFVAPIMHLDNKICGVILCAKIDFFYHGYYANLTTTMLNKTKETSHRFNMIGYEECSMCVMFYPLNDTPFVVEAGDEIVLQFKEKSFPIASCGLSLIYEGDVSDDSIVLHTPSTD